MLDEETWSDWLEYCLFQKRLLKLAELKSAQLTEPKQQQLKKDSKSSDGRRERRDYNKWEKEEKREKRSLKDGIAERELHPFQDASGADGTATTFPPCPS
jgi:hypothetical protein